MPAAAPMPIAAAYTAAPAARGGAVPRQRQQRGGDGGEHGRPSRHGGHRGRGAEADAHGDEEERTGRGRHSVSGASGEE